MWIERNEDFKKKVLALRDADKLLAYGNLLYRGDESTARDLDLAIECFIRAAEYKKTEAIHRLYFINEANAAIAEDKQRIEQILAKNNLYKCTARMLAVQTGKDLHNLMLNDFVNSRDWQQGFERLQFAAGRKDTFAKWELSLHYMVGRGCKQDCELAKKYAIEACKEYSPFKVFISEFCFSQNIPSWEEVLDKPELLSVSTIEELRDYSTPYYRRIPWSFMVLYPELVIKKIVSSTMVHSQEDFTAIWPEFYQLFDWETYNRYPWWRRKIPYWLLTHQPQFAELIPINWEKAKQNDIFLINQHQKFERYIKPELFSQDDFRKILHLRPEYAKFADMQNITGRKLVDDICKKASLHPLTTEERLLASIFNEAPHDKIVRWMESVEKHCSIYQLFNKKLDIENIKYLKAGITDIYFEQIQKFLNK